MGFFFKKKIQTAAIDVHIEGKSQAFYDRYIFGDNKLVAIANQVFAEVVRETISKADPLFKHADISKLLKQIQILRLELVGLYWMHAFSEVSAIKQGVFTQQYLEEKGLGDLWEEMNDYTQATAASVVNQAGSRKKPYILKMRLDLFSKYMAEYGIPPGATDNENDKKIANAIAKTINRKASETAWKKDLTKYYLALTLWKKINPGQDNEKLNTSADQQLILFIRGLYEGVAAEI